MPPLASRFQRPMTLGKSVEKIDFSSRIRGFTEPNQARRREKLRYDLSDETFLLNFAAWKDDSLSESSFSSLKTGTSRAKKTPQR